MKKNYSQWSQYWTMLYCSAMFLVFPLMFQNNYINMLEAKTVVYKWITMIYLIGGITVIWLISVFEAEDKRKRQRKNKEKKTSNRNFQWIGQDKWMSLFAVSVVLSTILSGNILNAWHSPDGKMFGSLIILLTCGMYFLVAKDGVFTNWILKGSLASGCTIVSLLAVLNRYQVDPLQMYSNLVPEQKHLYISTIGNVNILSGYLCVFVPLFAGLFLYSKNSVFKVISGFVFYIGVMAGICTNSDSFFLGIGAAMLWLFWIALEQKQKLLDYISLCMLEVLALFSLRVMAGFMPKQAVWENIQEKLVYEVPCEIILLLLLAIWCAIKYNKSEIPFLTIRKWIFISIGVSVLCLFVYIIILNTCDVDSPSSILVFNDKWGTNRGFVWKRTMLLFEELPFYKKITGIGPGAFKEMFAEYNKERIRQSLPPFADPHSEYLYYLISVGILGFTAYMGTIISAIRNCLKNKNEMNGILLTVVWAWIAQGFVNNPIVFTTPFSFILLGIISYENRKCSFF